MKKLSAITYKKSQLLIYCSIRYIHWISTVLFFFFRKRVVIKQFCFSFQEGGFRNSQSSSKISQKIFLGNLWLLICFFSREWEILIDILTFCDVAKTSWKKHRINNQIVNCTFWMFVPDLHTFVNLFHGSFSFFFL